jgi:hypothetical protein
MRQTDTPEARDVDEYYDASVQAITDAGRASLLLLNKHSR